MIYLYRYSNFLQHLRQLHEQQLALAAAEEQESNNKKKTAKEKNRYYTNEAEVLEEICKEHVDFLVETEQKLNKVETMSGFVHS